MKKLLALLLLLGIVGCSQEAKEPSLLDRCIAANKTNVDIDIYLLNSELELVSNEKLKQQWIDDYESIISFEFTEKGSNYYDDVEGGFFIYLGLNKDTGIPYEYYGVIDLMAIDEFEEPTTTIGNLYRKIQTQLSIEDDMRTYNLFNFQRHLDYNREYYGLSDELIINEQARSLCHSQGIY